MDDDVANAMPADLDFGMCSPWLGKETTPDDRDLRRMYHAPPEAREDRGLTRVCTLTRRAAALALEYQSFATGDDGRTTVTFIGRAVPRIAPPRFQRTRNRHGRAAPSRLLKKRRGVFCRRSSQEFHRSTHSTNAGGISLRTTMTRRMRSSRSSVTVPTRAASIVG
jgi:hypothetical protein